MCVGTGIAHGHTGHGPGEVREEEGLLTVQVAKIWRERTPTTER